MRYVVTRESGIRNRTERKEKGVKYGEGRGEG